MQFRASVPIGGLFRAVPILLLLLGELLAAGRCRSMPVGADGDRPRAGGRAESGAARCPGTSCHGIQTGLRTALVSVPRAASSLAVEISPCEENPQDYLKMSVFSAIEVFTGSTSQSCTERVGCHACDTFNPLRDECEHWSTVRTTSSPVWDFGDVGKVSGW